MRAKKLNGLYLGYLYSMACAAALAGCGADRPPEEPTASSVAAPPVQVDVPAGVEMDRGMQADLASLQADLSRMTGALAVPDSGMSIRVRGRGRVESADTGEIVTMPSGPATQAEAAVRDEPGGSRWIAVNLSTGNEFEIRLPRQMLDAAGKVAEQSAAQLGSSKVKASGEGPMVAGGLSNGADTREIRGTYGVAQTHDAYEKLVSLGQNGGCSGTLVGPKHIVTAAHCIRNFKSSAWRAGTAYAGRSGPNAFRASAAYSPSGAPTWYFVPASFLSIADGEDSMPFSATPYDIGVLVTHSSRMGDVVGWMGWQWWGADADFGNRTRYNRGYPTCGQPNSPADCEDTPLALWGDSEWCAAGSYSSPDSDGINRRFRFHCDISAGHSGSSLYHYLNGTTLVVTGITSWEHCKTCGAADDLPNTGVRITKEYSDVISSLRQAFP